MPTNRILASGVMTFALLTSIPLLAHADLTASFRAESIDGGCINGFPDPFNGEPERHFRMAIFDDLSLSQTCASGCETDDGNPNTLDVKSHDYCTESEGCGVWNFPDQTLTKVIPGGGGAYFYFGLFDYDLDASDSLGDNWVYVNAPRTNRTVGNNNNSPYKADNPIATVCGDDVEKTGSSSNYSLTYSIWFRDTTAPDVSASTPYNVDEGMSDVPENDTELEFRWDAASDPDSGIDRYAATLENMTTGTNVFTAVTAPSDGILTICPSGCDRTYTPIHDNEYRLRIRATNGDFPTIQNPRSAWSAWSAPVRVDLVEPTSSVIAPAESSWHNGDFSAEFEDSDDGIGIDPASCRWEIASGGVTTRNWASRTCNSSRTVTVGPTDYCRDEGIDTCVVNAESADLAGLMSMVGSRAFSIDWTEDAVGPVETRTMMGGALIAPTDWTTDRDPFFSWTAASSISPIDGYSWALDASPDCGSTEVDAAGPLQIQTPASSLTDGVHEFQVRAIDMAGNCGPVSSATVQVDGTPDQITGLSAVNGNGVGIASATWQQENRPTMQWDPALPASPIVGYSYGTGPTTDCTVETPATTVTLQIQSDGMVHFWVRAVDAAGNCGPAATFDIYIDTMPDSIGSVRAFTQQGGTMLSSGVAQLDTDPWMEWDIPVSTAPIAGYAWGTTAMTDCMIDGASPGTQLSGLPPGTTTFWVRAVDEAGNCGPAVRFDVVVSSCGDAMVSADEECDDGNSDNTDSCVGCMNATCGDEFVWENNEECDDGADNSDTEPDACRTTCVEAFCGDGVVDTGEGCDEGDANSDEPDATCRTNCAAATCGDGIVDEDEECDDGDANSDDEPGACRSNCVLPYCGDGIVDPDESCDDGDANSDDTPDACRTSCIPATCGDQVVDSDEECEPGQMRGDLICFDDCKFGSGQVDGDMGPTTGDDVGGSEPDAGNGEPDPTTSPDAGGVNMGADMGTNTDRQLVDSSVRACCGVTPSRTFNWWQLVLAAMLLGWSGRRRRHT